MSKKNIIVERTRNGELLSVDMILPSNFHAHGRKGPMMRAVCKDIMKWVKYLLLMPNTGPIDTAKKVRQYYEELMAIRDELGLERVELIMTIYLTDRLTWSVVENLARLPFRVEVKYYPPHKGATTGSGLGIPLSMVPRDTWKSMAHHGIPLLGHFESVYDRNGRELPMNDREAYFMENEFRPFRESVPELKICIEHASTRQAIALVKEDETMKTVCGMTPHHMLITIDELKKKSWANHGRCMPIPKGAADVAACRAFATSGDRRVILGDDTAPHPAKSKSGPFDTAACGCWLPHSLALYALAFEMEGALDERFVQFACFNGADWRRLPRPRPEERIRIVAETERDIPEPLPVPDIDDVVIPLGWTTEPDRLKVGLALALEQSLSA